MCTARPGSGCPKPRGESASPWGRKLPTPGARRLAPGLGACYGDAMRTFAVLCLGMLFTWPVRSDDAPTRVPLAKNVTLEIEGKKRRVLIESKVCLRQGQLEQLLTR